MTMYTYIVTTWTTLTTVELPGSQLQVLRKAKHTHITYSYIFCIFLHIYIYYIYIFFIDLELICESFSRVKVAQQIPPVQCFR